MANHTAFSIYLGNDSHIRALAVVHVDNQEVGRFALLPRYVGCLY